MAIYKNAEPTPDILWTYFIERVRQNLHLSLCFSPVGVKFRTRAQAFPGLVNGCTIDWFLPWPETALSDVATAYIGKFKELKGDADVRTKVIKHMAYVHSRMATCCEDYFERYRRNVYVTPKSYLGFIEEYQKVYVKKLEQISVLADSINVGLDKLLEAGADVEKMKIELKDKEKTLVVAQEKSAVLLQEITASTAKAEKKKAEVQAVKDTLAGEAEGIGSQKGSPSYGTPSLSGVLEAHASADAEMPVLAQLLAQDASESATFAGLEEDDATMEMTMAVGGILSKADDVPPLLPPSADTAPQPPSADDTLGGEEDDATMEMTTAVGGILGGQTATTPKLPTPQPPSPPADDNDDDAMDMTGAYDAAGSATPDWLRDATVHLAGLAPDPRKSLGGHSRKSLGGESRKSLGGDARKSLGGDARKSLGGDARKSLGGLQPATEVVEDASPPVPQSRASRKSVGSRVSFGGVLSTQPPPPPESEPVSEPAPEPEPVAAPRLSMGGASRRFSFGGNKLLEVGAKVLARFRNKPGGR